MEDKSSEPPRRPPVPAGGGGEEYGSTANTGLGGTSMSAGKFHAGHRSFPLMNFAASATVKVEMSYFKKLFRENFHRTTVYWSTFWLFGMCVAFLGPTLLDLGCLTSSDLRQMSWVFFAQSFFTLVGSLAGGYLEERFGSNPVLLTCCAVTVATVFMVPICPLLGLLALVLAIMGLNMGVIDTVANVSLIKIYGQDVAPFIQTLHFFYGLGAFLSPMIVQPFLLNEDCSPFVDNSTDSSLMDVPVVVKRSFFDPNTGNNHPLYPYHHYLHGKISNPVAIQLQFMNSSMVAEDLEEAQEKSNVRFAFWIMAGLQVPVVLLVSTLFMKRFSRGKDVIDDSDKEKYEDIDKNNWDDQLKSATSAKASRHFYGTKWHIILLTGLTAVLLFLSDGMQAAYAGYVYVYGMKSVVDLSTTEAVYLNACFWGFFAIGRLVSIYAATKLAPGFMLLCNLIGCFAAMTMMIGMRHDHITLYVGTCMFGIFLSSIYPSAITLIEQYISLTSTMTSVIVVGAAAGEMLMPVVIGNTFVSVGPVSLLVAGNVVFLLCLIIYVTIWITGRVVTTQHATRPGFWGLVDMFFPPAQDEGGLVKTKVKYYTRMSDSSSNMEMNEQNHSPQHQANH